MKLDLGAAFEQNFSAMKVLDWSQLEMFDYVGSQQQNSAFQQSRDYKKAIQCTMTLRALVNTSYLLPTLKLRQKHMTCIVTALLCLEM